MFAQRLAVVVLAAGASALPAAGAGAATPPPTPSVQSSPLLWATINVCDTLGHPDTIGIRASMPGSGVAAEQMFIRFKVQYLDETNMQWVDMGVTADSGFLPLGSGRYKRRESGRNFAVTPPPQGQTYRLRGSVTFEWRRGDRVVRRAMRRTRTGHPGTVGADPKGFTASECAVTA